jgi:hypothetical protein
MLCFPAFHQFCSVRSAVDILCSVYGMVWVLNLAAAAKTSVCPLCQTDQPPLVDIVAPTPAPAAGDAPAANVPSVGAPQGDAQALVVPAHSDQVETQIAQNDAFGPLRLSSAFILQEHLCFKREREIGREMGRERGMIIYCCILLVGRK